jgi:hypothetical protein
MAREKNYRGVPLVRGEAKEGDRVAYEDMANPRREGTVVEVVSGYFGTHREYRVRWDEPWTDEAGQEVAGTISDCRQYGWVMVEEATEGVTA